MARYLLKVFFLCIVLFTLICSLTGHTLYAQEEQEVKVIKVKIEGLKNVPKRDIKGVIKTKKGKEFDSEVLDEDLQSIYNLALFSNVEVDVKDVEEGVEVTFIVEEKPIIKKVDFRGNEHISRRLLRDEISLKKRGAFDKGVMKDDRIKITSLYKDKGYANVRVEAYPTIDEKTEQVKVVFFIMEGKKVTIGSVDIIGVQAFKKKKVFKLLKKTKRKKVFKEDLFQEDLDRIITLYRNHGYLEVEILEPEITYTDEESKVNILLNIAEGVKYNVGNINFMGNIILTDKELRDTLELKENEVYNQEKFDETRQNIESVYAEKGYVFMRVQAETQTNAETKIVDISFDITEGPLVYVGKIFITGNDRTKDYVIRREILLKEGDPFNRTRIQRSQQKIYNLGYFKEVNLSPRPSGKDQLDLIFELEEQQTNTISAGVGYSSVDKLLGTVELGINNLFGRGQRLSLLYEIGLMKKYYEIDFTEPWLFGRPYSFGIGIYDKIRMKDYEYTINGEEKTDRYKEERKGGSIRLGHRFKDFYTVRFAYKYEDVAIFDANEDNETLKIKQDSGWENTSSLTTTFIRDNRDNIFDASRGSRHSISTEVAGGIFGGNHHFTKYIGETSWYFPTIGRLVLALHAQAGIVDHFGLSNEVPIYEKFFVGGAETIRGYSYYGEIGPSDGAKSMLVINIEYKLSIPETPIQFAIFYDAGNAWGTINHPSYDLKEGIGAGIRFLTPVFPIRLDYGYGLQHKPGEEKGRWYFTIGQIF